MVKVCDYVVEPLVSDVVHVVAEPSPVDIMCYGSDGDTLFVTDTRGSFRVRLEYATVVEVEAPDLPEVFDVVPRAARVPDD